MQKIQIIGKGQSVAMRTAANDNQIILKGSFLQREQLPKDFFAKDLDHPEGPGFCMGTVANNYLHCKKNRSYEGASLLQRGRLLITI